MSKQSDNALAAIERLVFRNDRPMVVALTGGWGEGKTYFWQKKVIPHHKDKRPGYVSVFGAESIAVIRERVAVAATHLADLAESGSMPEWMAKITGPVATGLRKAATFWGGKIGVSDSVGVELLQSFALKPGWIVCIDDVERLSKEVGYGNFLGYVTELRDRWQLKVVLIYNKEPLENAEDKAKDPFLLYQEKAIDRSIPFAPDFKEVVDLVFADVSLKDRDPRADIEEKAQILGLRNIRILTRAKNYFDEVLQVVGKQAEPEFLLAALRHVLLFSFVRFSNPKPEGLTFEMLETHSGWTDRFHRSAARNAGKEEEESVSAAKALIEKFGYEAADDLARLLIAFVRGDVLDAAGLTVIYADYISESGKQASYRRLRDMWDRLYHGTFRDNPEELADAVEKVLPENIPHIPPGELDFALEVLRKLGREGKALEFFEEFKTTRGSIFQALDESSMPHGQYNYPPLKEFLRSIQTKNKKDDRSLKEVMATAFADRFIMPADSARLAKFTADDLVNYLTTNDQTKLTAKLRLLVTGSDETVKALALRVAAKIARLSPLNRMRLEGMGLVAPRKKRVKKPRIVPGSTGALQSAQTPQ